MNARTEELIHVLDDNILSKSFLNFKPTFHTVDIRE